MVGTLLGQFCESPWNFTVDYLSNYLEQIIIELQFGTDIPAEAFKNLKAYATPEHLVESATQHSNWGSHSVKKTMFMQGEMIYKLVQVLAEKEGWITKGNS